MASDSLFHYKQPDDPGAVGAGRYWLDDSDPASFVPRRRNEANDGWVLVGPSGVVAAENVSYNNAVSLLTATDVQAALDELENEIDAVEAAIPTASVSSMLYSFLPGRVYTQESTLPGYIGNVAILIDVLYAWPFIVPKTTDFDQVSLQVMTAIAGSNIRVGMYNDSNGKPGSLIADWGVISAATTGYKRLTVAHTESGGKKWLSLVCSHNGVALTGVFNDAAKFSFAVLGINDGDLSSFGVANRMISRAFPYAALPDPWGTSTSFSVMAYRVGLRVT